MRCFGEEKVQIKMEPPDSFLHISRFFSRCVVVVVVVECVCVCVCFGFHRGEGSRVDKKASLFKNIIFNKAVLNDPPPPSSRSKTGDSTTSSAALKYDRLLRLL